MFVVQLKNGLPIAIHTSVPEELALGEWDENWQTRHDWNTFEEVQRLASYITAMTGQDYLPVDHGDHVFPRYDLVECPKIGEPVSRAFNGDYYSIGFIEKITKNLQVTTSTGLKFRRRGLTSSWIQEGGTWSLVPGHINELNPHF